MNYISTIAPKDGWKPGDRVYCVRGSRETSPPLETGRTYLVEHAEGYSGIVPWALILEGIDFPGWMDGLSSGRFVKLRTSHRPLDEITRFTTPVWIDAYRASVGQAPHPDD